MTKRKFRRHDAHKCLKLSESWRKPRGRQNKVRLQKRGYKRGPSVGYGNPADARGLVQGLIPVIVAHEATLERLDPKREGAIIQKSVGAKKREALLKQARERNITILNLDAERALAHLHETFHSRQKVKAEREKKVAQKRAQLEEQVEKATKSEGVAQKQGAQKDASHAAKEATAEQTGHTEKEDVKKEKAEEKKQRDKILTKKTV